VSKKLLIVESPTKARTITRMLGNDYKIMASMGHVRDLPERSFGVDLKNNFAPMYTDNPRSRKVVADLKNAVKRVSEVYLAPDPDREGEAIAWHLSEVLKDDFKNGFKRVTFHEITRTAIERALQNSSTINMDLVDAQQARRVLDRIVGYQVSPLLWSQIARGISAGRVQSVALRLVVERERAIRSFVPEEYWVIAADFATDAQVNFSAKLVKINGKETKINGESEAKKVIGELQDGAPFAISAITQTNRQRTAPPPFTTSTMQQLANSQLHFSASATMRYAQQLYEGVDLGDGETVGLITYMRTDSVNIAAEAQKAALEFISRRYGKEFCPARPNRYKSKALAQEAHEAIRPTDVNRTPESLSGVLDSAQLKLYTLIWNRFVASQMTPAKLKLTAVDVTKKSASGTEYLLRANAQITVFAGFTVLFPDNKRDDAGENSEKFAKLAENDNCDLLKINDEQKFTEPPPRFSEATLIKELEENGIGRPSTYATILKTIQAREYVVREKNSLIPSELGFKVNDLLVSALPELFQVPFTRKMEVELDEIEAGKLRWTDMLKNFYDRFSPWLEAAKQAGSADADKSAKLVKMLENVQWSAPVKVGGKIYDDKKFFDSISQKYDHNNRLSIKQFSSLIELAAKYRDQLPEIGAVVAELGAEEEFAAAERKLADMAAKANAPAGPRDVMDYAPIFEKFAGVKWEPATTRRGRSFDDKKFFNSLREQAENGRTLSEKQLAVLRRLATKYRATVTDFDTLAKLLNLQPRPAPAAEASPNAEAKALLDKLQQVSKWAEPVRQGKRVYDDQAFYKSLAEQFKNGKTLSEKQLAALKKLAAKYPL